jgi:archaellum component FlaC
MKDIIALQERLNLVEQELKTLTERVGTLSERLDESLQEKEDLNKEIKGLMVFLGRIYPDFKTQFPAILQKLDD